MEWAGSLGASHGDRKETKATGLNVSTSAVSLPNFIVIKIPETVPAPHTSMALVPERPSPQSSKYSLVSWGRRNQRGPMCMCPLRA